MSLAAARAMRDLAVCLDEEVEAMPPGQGFAVLSALARVHHKVADRLEARARELEKGVLPVPAEYRDPMGAGTRRGS